MGTVEGGNGGSDLVVGEMTHSGRGLILTSFSFSCGENATALAFMALLALMASSSLFLIDLVMTHLTVVFPFSISPQNKNGLVTNVVNHMPPCPLLSAV